MLFSVAWLFFFFFALFIHLCCQYKYSRHKQICLSSFYIKKDIEYFILTATNLSIYTATEAIDSHFNFRGTKTGNFLLLQVATFAIFQNGMFKFQPLCQWILWHWISGYTGEEGELSQTGGSSHWMKDINATECWEKKEREIELEKERRNNNSTKSGWTTPKQNQKHEEEEEEEEERLPLRQSSVYHSHLVSSPFTNSLDFLCCQRCLRWTLVQYFIHIFLYIFLYKCLFSTFVITKNTTYLTNAFFKKTVTWWVFMMFDQNCYYGFIALYTE